MIEELAMTALKIVVYATVVIAVAIYAFSFLADLWNGDE